MNKSDNIGYYLLTKNFENFLFKKNESLTLFNLNVNALSYPGIIFLNFLNNFNSIIEVLERSKKEIKEPYYMVADFIEKELKPYNEFFSKFFSIELNNAISKFNQELSSLTNSLESIKTEINSAIKSNELDLLDDLKIDENRILKELNIVENRDLRIEKYISDLISNLQNYKLYLDLYFGITNNKELKNKNISYFQSLFYLHFRIPSYTMDQVFIDKNKIVFTNNLMLDCYKSLKESSKKEHISDDEIYFELLKANQKLVTNKNLLTLKNYEISSFEDLFSVFFNYLIENNININKCKNCNKYFIPENRSDEKYCNNPVKHGSKITCKTIGARKSFANNRKQDPISTEDDKTRSRLTMRIKRAKNKNNETDIIKYTNALTKYYSDYEKQLKKYKNNKLSEKEFISWMKEQ